MAAAGSSFAKKAGRARVKGNVPIAGGGAGNGGGAASAETETGAILGERATITHYPFSRPAGTKLTEEEIDAMRAFDSEEEEAAWYAARENDPAAGAPTTLPASASPAPMPRFENADQFAEWLTQNPEGGGNIWTAAPAQHAEIYDVAVYTPAAQDTAQVNGLVGYHFHGRMGMGSPDFVPQQEAEPGAERRQTFTYFADCTKSPSDDYLAASHSGEIEDYLQNGTPVRKTDRAGAGTKGTRRYEGVGGGAMRRGAGCCSMRSTGWMRWAAG